jgi:hypothetical protein
VLTRDPRVRDATVVGWPLGMDLRVHAVLLLDDPSLAAAVVRDANAVLGAHQQIRGSTVWPDEDLPRTHALKVKKHVVLERLAQLAVAAADGSRPGVGHRPRLRRRILRTRSIPSPPSSRRSPSFPRPQSPRRRGYRAT